ncbi:hypothetical protein SBV1_10005 [Verrucomicrobia bacterium]|nr:hypothetical protein SBV1_10005 [Verrucomicrobiota bacterium]
MKPEIALTKAQIPHAAEFGPRVSQAYDDATEATRDAIHKCLHVGTLLNEWKTACGHGQFLKLLRTEAPQISEDTAERWMRAAANLLAGLPVPPDCRQTPVSTLLSTPPEHLPAPARKWRLDWKASTSGKTIKDCLCRLSTDGDRAQSGKRKEEKSISLFVAQTMRRLGRRLSGWTASSEHQKGEVKEVVSAAFQGATVKLGAKVISFDAWPLDICEAIAQAAARAAKFRNSCRTKNPITRPAVPNLV